MRPDKTNGKSYLNQTHNGLYRQVGDELGVDYVDVAMGAGDLAPDAEVVRAVALVLGLLNVCHPLAAVSRHVLCGVYQCIGSSTSSALPIHMCTSLKLQ